MACMWVVNGRISTYEGVFVFYLSWFKQLVEPNDNKESKTSEENVHEDPDQGGGGEREREKKQKTLQISAETQVPMPPSGNKKKHTQTKGGKKKKFTWTLKPLKTNQ